MSTIDKGKVETFPGTSILMAPKQSPHPIGTKPAIDWEQKDLSNAIEATIFKREMLGDFATTSTATASSAAAMELIRRPTRQQRDTIRRLEDGFFTLKPVMNDYPTTESPEVGSW